jgi:ankyrin repeat protein
MEQFLKFNSDVQRQIAINLYPSEQKKLCSLMGNKSICKPDDPLWKERLKNETGLTLSAKDVYYLVDGISRKSKYTNDYLIEFIINRDISDVDVENISWENMAANKIFADDTLLRKYANSIDRKGEPLLVFAIISKGTPLVKKLLELGAKPNMNSEHSPIISAALYGQTEMVNLLLQHGAKVNIENENGQTPLIAAAYMGYKNIVEILLNNRADPTYVNKNGKTALDFAIKSDQKEIIDMLRRAIENIK